ncbi:hypothetical protein AB0K12_11310 [Nonomuraea sp. NPDC049419]|uniref:hypothetical protein n=1 Tax=Nonomuraea sp. NPDC049419 TaxID=3155772 RepID=UPI00343C65FD
MTTPGRAKRAMAKLIFDDNLDLYILAATALIFTVMGSLNVIDDTKTLASVILALLAFLALSQIRSRRHIAEVTRSQRMDLTDFFMAAFPAELHQSRASADTWLFIGNTMSRTLPTMRGPLRRSLARGSRVQVLLLDPTNAALMQVASQEGSIPQDADHLAETVKRALDELLLIRDGTQGFLEVRVASFLPKIGVNAIDAETANAVVYVQHYEHRPPGEAAPIFKLTPQDGFWYAHYVAEARRMWEEGTPWPLSKVEAISRLPRPGLMAAYGSHLEQAMAAGRELLITGVTRNTLINSNYANLEEWLSAGTSVRVVLVDPESPAAKLAADRYYAERSVTSVKERIWHTLRLLQELKHSTGGDISVRLSQHPIAMGIVGVDTSTGKHTDTSSLFLEYFSYRARGEPKQIIRPHDGEWFEHFVAEAEKIWSDATPVDLDETRISNPDQ